MLSPASPFICLSWATVVENWRAMLKSVSPGRTRYIRGAPVVVAFAVVDAGLADGAAGSAVVDGAGMASVWRTAIRALSERPFASLRAADETPYLRATAATVSPFFT